MNIKYNKDHGVYLSDKPKIKVVQVDSKDEIIAKIYVAITTLISALALVALVVELNK